MAIIHKSEHTKGVGRILYICVYAILIIGIPLQCFPTFWMLTNSVKESAAIRVIPPIWIPENFYWAGYPETFAKFNLWNNIWNTFVICASLILVQATTSALAAYSLSKLRPKFGNTVLLLFLGTMMISGQALMFPLYLVMANLGLLNTKLSYILASSAWAYCIVMFKSFFDGLPDELLESARIDGAGNMRIFFRIVLPLSLPVVVVLMLNTFLAGYNDFVLPLLLMPDEKNWTLMMRVYNAQGNAPLNNVYVLLTVTVVPVIIIYLFAQKYIKEGVSVSGLKG